MIGVAVSPTERLVVTEFFELFKTPWEFYRSSGRYDVVLTTADILCSEATGLVLILNGKTTSFEIEQKIKVTSRAGGFVMSGEGERLPIYGTLATFRGCPDPLLKEEHNQEPVAFVSHRGAATILRVGYNLFEEVRYLLTVGQPASNAGIPTLDNHIAWLRSWISLAGIPLVEIPPIPAGYSFIACLTHDIDHPLLRNHWGDHTMFGFLYRSTIGALLNFCQGRKPFRNLWRNLEAACLLPLVRFGLAKDFWAEFDRYTQIEAGHASTFFVIPQKNYPGRTSNGFCSSVRACRYHIEQLLPQLRRIALAGSEVGLHGLDAWLDFDAACGERERISRTIGSSTLGVRMHWLHFDENSPSLLDRAGFSYDTTVGYNETVGYRVGTLQAYRPLGVDNLLELPLHVMDTALFYPVCLDLTEEDAERIVRKLIDDAQKIGGALTIDWHDRSIAPERLWDNFYLQLLEDLKARGAWLPTAAQAVSWFRKRRAAKVESIRAGENVIRIRCRIETAAELPGLTIRINKPRLSTDFIPMGTSREVESISIPLHGTMELDVAI
jgi:hypothetical protein